MNDLFFARSQMGMSLAFSHYLCCHRNGDATRKLPDWSRKEYPLSQ
jgi:hypothetical protein